MTRTERMQRLAGLIKAVGGTIDGRKKLHKLVYLCQAKGLDFGHSFIFHFYGVYSPSLAADLEIAEDWGLLKQEMDVSGAYQISLNKDACEGMVKPSPLIVNLDRVGGYKGKALSDKLVELKGHLKRYIPDAKVLAQQYFGIKCV